jgi:peptidoglycan hydrolase-like protein with peptidoglycan-binding domain
MRRRTVIGGAGLLVAVIVAGGAVATGAVPTPVTGSPTASADPASAAAAIKTAAIERRTIVAAEDLDGTLGYDGTRSVAAGAPGTITWLPAAGTVIQRGGRLYELDGSRRPRLFYGARPFWRTLDKDVSDGFDVQELEANLKALGYAPRGTKVNRHWDAKTTTAVKRWERATGQTRDGIVRLGDVVVLPGAIRVTEAAASLGGSVGPGAPVLTGSGTTKIVTVQLSATRRALLGTGDAVTITLPDDTQIAGHVQDVGRVATAGDQGGSPTVPVTIAIDDAAAAPDLDRAPVTVHAVTDTHANVLAVPVEALVALREGGYAVEIVDGSGKRHYVGVTLGLFQDGMVEITGAGLAEGQKVVVPS